MINDSKIEPETIFTFDSKNVHGRMDFFISFLEFVCHWCEENNYEPPIVASPLDRFPGFKIRAIKKQTIKK